jgi:alkylated DNA nucleotide flippase Atl1
MKWQRFGDRERGSADGASAEPDAAFWASPVGRAARAKLRGDRFFQIELDDATLTAYAETAAISGGGRRARRTCDLLGQIEELGWHLEHVSWWRVDADESASSDRATATEQGADHVRGIYLFHSVQAIETDHAETSGPTRMEGHAPTHRREVS